MDEPLGSTVKGAAAIRQHCEQHGYADFVIEDGLEYLIPSWERTVQEVVDGYDSMDVEYLNDVGGRHIIQEVWPLASDEQHMTYQHRLSKADRRFMEATDPVPECICGPENEAEYSYTPEANWYYYREPKIKGPNW